MNAATHLNEASKSSVRPSPHDFAHQVDLYASNQLHRLEKQIDRRLQELLALESKLKTLEEELTYFSETYYDAVGPLCEEIQALEQALQERSSSAIHSQERAQSVHVKSDATARKALYRRLVKTAHPDSVASSDATKFMKIQQAYESGKIAALWQVEWENLQAETRQCEPLRRMQKLLSWFQQLECYGNEITTRYTAIKHSDTAQLMQRYIEARLAGRDWLGQMKQQLQGQAEQLKYRLVNQRLQALLKE